MIRNRRYTPLTHLTPSDEAIAAVASRQDGVISHPELVDLGLTAEQIRRRVETGRLIRLHRGVYAVGHTALTTRAKARAAVMACGPRAVLSHQSAAALFGFRPEWHGAPHVTVPTTRRHKGIVSHRSALAPEDVVTRRGIRMTTPARTLVDLADVLPERQLQTAINEAEVQRLTTRAEVIETRARTPGRRGARRLTKLLAEPTRLTRSELERDFLALTESSNLPTPETNTRIEGLEADFAWRDKRLIVEVDGFTYHGTRQAFERDRERDARLQAQGWRVVRFTYRQVQRRSEAARTLRQIYDAT